jgi:uncharacterized membrane protein YczE
MTLGVSKIWQWISLVLIGFAAGIIVAVKYIVGPTEEINIEFKKVKQKIRGKGHKVEDTFDIPVTVIAEDRDKKTKRQKRSAARKAKRHDPERDN